MKVVIDVNEVPERIGTNIRMNSFDYNVPSFVEMTKDRIKKLILAELEKRIVIKEKSVDSGVMYDLYADVIFLNKDDADIKIL